MVPARVLLGILGVGAAPGQLCLTALPRARPSRRTLAAEARLRGRDWNYCPGPESLFARNFFRAMISLKTLSNFSRRDGAGTRVQRRQGGEPGAPEARNVRGDDEICRGGQTPGQQQVNLSVEIEVPGSWFGGTEMGSLNASERRQKYKAQAVEYAEVREFPGASLRACKVKGFGRRLRVCESMCLHTTCRAELWPAWTWALGALGQLASELLQSGRHGAWGRERAAFAVCRTACAGHAWGECV